VAVVEVDVFDVDDPLGTPLGTIDSSEAEAIDWRIGIRGDPGEGHVLINRHHSAAALIAPDRIYKVRVPVIDSGYLHAFIQKDARYTLAHPKEEGAETLDLFGPGLKALFAQARLLWQIYAPGQTARGSEDHAHDLWWWIDEPYGAIATRIIEEGINQPGTPLADMNPTFSRTHDSDGTPWANIADEWQETVGTDVLSILGRLEEAGDFYIEVLPDLTVNAYQSYPVRDLTASVHIQKGVNLMTTLKRTIHGRPAITHLELEDSDGNYSLEVDPGWSSGERGNIGYYKASTNDDTTLNKIGQEVIRRSRSSLQPLELEVDPLQLLPGPEGSANGDYWINCNVSLTSGDGPQDYDEESVLVTGLRFSLDTAVDNSTEATRRKSLRIVTECNVETISDVDPKQGFGNPASARIPQPCVPGLIVPGFERLGLIGAACSNSGANLASDHPAWAGDNEERVEITAAFAIDAGRSLIARVGVQQADWGAEPDTVYDEQGNTWTKDAEHENTASSSDDTIQIWRCNVTNPIAAGDYIRWALNLGADASPADVAGGRCIAVYAYSSALTVATVGTGAGTFSSTPSISTPAGDLVVAGICGPITALSGGDGDWLDAVPNTYITGSGSEASSVYGQDLLNAGATTWTPSLSSSQDWAAIAVGYTAAEGGTGRVNDGHPDLVGTARRWARCDHRHDVHRDTAPTVNDDWATAGYKLGTIWAQLDDLDAPTEIVAVWMLVDDSTGAAVWAEWPGGGVTDHGALSGLADDDHPQYMTQAEHDALRWEAVTNGADVFVWEGDDLVHEWKAY